MSPPLDDPDEFAERLGRGLPLLKAMLGDVAAQTDVRVSSTDSTGCISVTLAPDGLPDSIVVGPDWRRLVGAERFAAGVTEALRAAGNQADEIAGTPAVARLMEQMDAVVGYLAGGPPPPGLPDRPPPDPIVTARPPTAPLWTPEMLDELMAVPPASGFDASLLGALHEATGSGAQGRLTLRATLAMVTCEADADWVSGQDTDLLNEALATTVAALRADREAAAAESAASVATPARLLDQARERLLRQQSQDQGH